MQLFQRIHLCNVLRKMYMLVAHCLLPRRQKCVGLHPPPPPQPHSEGLWPPHVYPFKLWGFPCSQNNCPLTHSYTASKKTDLRRGRMLGPPPSPPSPCTTEQVGGRGGMRGFHNPPFGEGSLLPLQPFTQIQTKWVAGYGEILEHITLAYISSTHFPFLSLIFLWSYLFSQLPFTLLPFPQSPVHMQMTCSPN